MSRCGLVAHIENLTIDINTGTPGSPYDVTEFFTFNEILTATEMINQ